VVLTCATDPHFGTMCYSQTDKSTADTAVARDGIGWGAFLLCHGCVSRALGLAYSARSIAIRTSSIPAQNRALDHSQSVARLTNPRRTGFAWMYDAISSIERVLVMFSSSPPPACQKRKSVRSPRRTVSRWIHAGSCSVSHSRACIETDRLHDARILLISYSCDRGRISR